VAERDELPEPGEEAAGAGRRRRPVELILVVVFCYLAGLLDVLLGIVLIFSRYSAEGEMDGVRQLVTISGAVTLLFGFLEMSLASVVARGDRKARVTLTALLAIGFGLDLLVFGIDTTAWYELADVLLSAAVIVVLWTGRVARYFARSSA